MEIHPVHVCKQVIPGFGVRALVSHQTCQHAQRLSGTRYVLGCDYQIHDTVQMANPSVRELKKLIETWHMNS